MSSAPLATTPAPSGTSTRSTRKPSPPHAEAIAATRGEAAQATKVLYLAINDIDTTEAYDSADVVRDQTEHLRGTAPIPSDTLDAWAKALRSAT